MKKSGQCVLIAEARVSSLSSSAFTAISDSDRTKKREITSVIEELDG